MDSFFDPIVASSSSPPPSPNRKFQAEASTMNDSTQISSSNDSILVFSNLRCFYEIWETLVNGELQKIDLNLSSSKFWIKNEFHCLGNEDLSLFLSKIYRFDAKELWLSSQTISYDELLILSSNVEDLEFNGVTVKYDNGSIVPLEKIVEACPKIKSIECGDSRPSNILSQTFKELLKIHQFLTLSYCGIKYIPEDFDIESFYTYMKKNKHTRFYLSFSYFISIAYKNRLEGIVDEIIEDENRDYKPPRISFLGLNGEKEKKLEELYYR